MSSIRSYRDLKVWQSGIELAVNVYKVTETFPKSEQFGLTSQLRRAAVSVPSNIAEGEQRKTTADYIRFCHISLGSTGELDTQFEIAKRLSYLSENDLKLFQDLHEIRRMLNGLIASLESRINNRVREGDPPYGEPGPDSRD